MVDKGRVPVCAANWKMHKTIDETRDFFKGFLPEIDGITGCEIIIAPPFTALKEASDAIAELSDIVSIAGQNMHYAEQGAYTGEISPVMLKEVGARYVILGHSERRHIFGEDNPLIAQKMKSALDHGLSPILCIGETLEEREDDLTTRILDFQLNGGLDNVTPQQITRVILAYEPVWAIGTGKTASPEQAQEAHEFMRNWLKSRYDSGIADQIRILYGGSVKPDNIASLMMLPDVDGVLVGGASLEAASFSAIVQGCVQ